MKELFDPDVQRPTPALRIGRVLALLLVLGSCGSEDLRYTVVLDGFNDPRGLWIRADGTLCAAEAGRLAEGQEVREGPTANLAHSGSVSCVDGAGIRRRIIENLPYVFYNVTGVTTGPADVSELNSELYVLTGEGEGALARSILRVTDSVDQPDVVADFLTFAIETTQPDFFDEIDIISNPFAMIADPANRRFLVTDGATGQVLAAGLDGDIQVFSETAGHEVLTGIVRGPDGLAYVASFSQLPHAEGSGAVLRLHPDGTLAVAADNLTTPIDLAFDASGRLLVLEFIDDTDTGDPYRGKSGRLVRLEPAGDRWIASRVLVEGLPFPTALLIDGQDRVYISVHGAFSSPSSGLVLRFDNLAQVGSSGASINYEDRS